MEVSQACRHVAGGEASEQECTFLKNDEEFSNRTFAGGKEMRRLHAAVQVVPCHPFRGERNGARASDAISRPSGENDCVIWGTLARC